VRRHYHRSLGRLAVLLVVAVVLGHAIAGATPAAAQAPTPADSAERVRQTLFDAQTALLTGDPAGADEAVRLARETYAAEIEGAFTGRTSAAAELAESGFDQARRAIEDGDATALARARGTIWTALLFGAAELAVDAAGRGDASEAQQWILLRAFSPATRISRPGSDATLALQDLRAGRVAPDAAAAEVRADLLDTYQALTLVALDDMLAAGTQGLALRQAEASALAAGYWRIIATSYQEQRGLSSRQQVDALAAALSEAAGANPAALPDIAASLRQALRGFRATPLAPEEAARRASQLLRFLSLVPFEYRQGVHDGRVILAIEVEEAITFRDAAGAAFDDLAGVLFERDAEAAAEVDNLLRRLDDTLRQASTRTAVAEPERVDALTKEITAALQDIYPAEWRTTGGGPSDFDTLRDLLNQLEAAVAAGQYGQAESLRLEAYAVFDLGPELHLLGLAPGLAARVEGHFWHGYDGTPGLASLLARRAPPADVHATRLALDDALAEADARLGAGPPARGAVIFNAAIIVFREGLEAVLIFASLLASLVGAKRAFRRPMVTGAALAGVATVATWLLIAVILSSLRRYGERLEAIVSLVAIAVLLLILNWFFHDAYWSRWIQRFHGRKRSLVGAAAGQTLGFILIGFTSIYREGFETTLFLQALVLDAGTLAVLEGVALGLVATTAVGVLVFALQTKLPYKRMLIVTGLLITGVLVIMVGNTVHLFQAVGWLPITLIDGAEFPYWAGVWLGLYPTWEGLIAQAAAAVFVIGSYVLAEQLQQREQRRAAASVVARS
jgi:high-affinity iron transporter